jgi:serine/threonine-protein kinase
VLAPPFPASPPPGVGPPIGAGPGTVTRLANRYRLEQRLGRGGWSEVWRGYDEVLARAVAIKLSTHPEEVGTVENFQREAQTLAKLEHPNVVAIFDIGVDQGIAFEVMELLRGPSLSRLLAEHGPLPVAESLRMTADTAFGLAAAHSAGVVHRDVKPANLVMGADGSVHLVDFGIARVRSTTEGPVRDEEDGVEGASGSTQADRIPAFPVVGTPEFLSPEAIAGRPVGPKADLYALGCVLFALLTDTPPYSGPDAAATLRLHLSAPVPDIRQRRPEVPPQVARLVFELLQKDPARRPSTALDVAHRLRSLEQMVLAHPPSSPPAVLPATIDDEAGELADPGSRLVARTIVSRRTAGQSRPAATASPNSTAHAASYAARSRRKRRRHRWLAVAVPLVVVGAAFLTVAFTSWNHPAAAPKSPGPTHPSVASATTPTTSSSSSANSGQSSTPPGGPSNVQNDNGSISGYGSDPTVDLSILQRELAHARVALNQSVGQGMVDDSTASALRSLIHQDGVALSSGDLESAANVTNELVTDVDSLGQSGAFGDSVQQAIAAPLNDLAALLPAPQ